MNGTAASTKVWRRIGVHARDALVKTFTPAELRTILSDVARSRSAAMTTADLMRRWREDALLAPSAFDPREVFGVVQRMWDALPPEFLGTTLSPLVPLGTGVHLGGRGQNRLIATMRGSELLADPVHGLALEAAKLRRSGHARVHLATQARAIQSWEHEAGDAHELRFSLVSSAPDGGALSTEAELLDLHLDYWREVMGVLVPHGRVQVVVWDATLADMLAERGTLDDLIVVPGSERTPWRNPYATAAFRFVVDDGEADQPPLELGDGGFVPWTQALTRNRKDRCLVSGISVDLLVQQTWNADPAEGVSA